MEPWLQTAITVFCSVAASSGFWAWMSKRSDKNDARTKLLLGICHDRMLYLGLLYIDRGYLSRDEYINIVDYLSVPYFELGGNGACHRIIEDVKKLPIRDSIPRARNQEGGV